MKIIFMGSSDFAIPALQALIDSEHEVIAVYSKEPKPANRGQKETLTPIHKLALEHGIRVYSPKSFKRESEVEMSSRSREFIELKADIAVVVSYGLILPKDILNGTKYGAINIHPSALPRWRGAAPIQRTIMADDQTTQVNIIQMDEGVDTGDILNSQDVDILPQMTFGELQSYTAEIGAKLLLKTLDDLTNNRINKTKQSNKNIKYAEKISKAECHIKWDMPVKKINNLVRACSPFPGAFFIYKDEIFKVFSIEIMTTDSKIIKKLYTNHAPGKILSDEFDIACLDGVIRPFVVQRQGRKPMHIDKLLNGFKVKIGEFVG